MLNSDELIITFLPDHHRKSDKATRSWRLYWQSVWIFTRHVVHLTDSPWGTDLGFQLVSLKVVLGCFTEPQLLCKLKSLFFVHKPTVYVQCLFLQQFQNVPKCVFKTKFRCIIFSHICFTAMETFQDKTFHHCTKNKGFQLGTRVLSWWRISLSWRLFYTGCVTVA